MNGISRKELLAGAKERESWKPDVFETILVVPNRSKHDSGYSWIRLYGKPKHHESELYLLGYCDDIIWELNGQDLRTDCFYPSGVLQFWKRDCNFKVGMTFSSTRIELVKRTD